MTHPDKVRTEFGLTLSLIKFEDMGEVNMDATARPHVLVQGTADWHQPIATNQHYMARELSEEFDITFVESLGLRRPEINVRDLSRIWRRLAGKRTLPLQMRDIPKNLRVVSPKVVPNHSGLWRTLNRMLLSRYLDDWVASEQRIFWTYSPVTYGFESGADVAVYHCVDLYGSFPGIDSGLVDREERRLAATGVVAVGSSEIVVDHLQKQGFDTVHYWPNVADVEEFAKAMQETESPRSGAVFAGNLTEKKVDFDLLLRLVSEGVELNLAGPEGEGGGSNRSRLAELVARGAKYHGMLSLQDLAKLMVKCKVGLIPYKITPYTRGVSPLKTYEYLAAGLSVVSTPLPGVESMEPHVVVAEDNDIFVSATLGALSAQPGSVADRIKTAEGHSWTGRGETARALVRTLMSASWKSS